MDGAKIRLNKNVRVRENLSKYVLDSMKLIQPEINSVEMQRDRNKRRRFRGQRWSKAVPASAKAIDKDTYAFKWQKWCVITNNGKKCSY